MKILVFGDRLEIGGSQVNAIELAAALRDQHGHEIIYVATAGPMLKLIQEKGLKFIEVPDARRHPSPARMRALRAIVKSERPDLVQVWDWWQCLDAYWSLHLSLNVPMLVTDMTMAVGRVLPKAVTTTFGTPELVDIAREHGHRDVDVLVPPVDVQFNRPGVVDSNIFRHTWGIDANEVLVVTVSRFAATLKAESLRRTIDAVRILNRELPLRLVLVGDGEIREELQRLADAANTELGRQSILLTGQLTDPRPAYAAANVVIGMGGSALRALAFAKPVIVVGEQGFSEPFGKDSAASFHYKGIFGIGNGDALGSEKLVRDLRGLIGKQDELSSLGNFGREFVVEHYSLESLSARLSAICERVRSQAIPRHIKFYDGFRTGGVVVGGALRPLLRWPPKLPPPRPPQPRWDVTERSPVSRPSSNDVDRAERQDSH